ncbi:dithiol-disulfide isomerase [Chryseobacterium angstadtii]|uniref:Dithiol-disulfide isomerase n=1 Tax=Chryseobacterium angstadtii TaxID=558151 RepID=A0A0J7IFS6_9FLAO|nr:DsbA family protein [Chryseobacterium angstadtii]KMQ64806.1 dithiol-disulfide isomerase [Chryseobacterium angstadtii]
MENTIDHTSIKNPEKNNPLLCNIENGMCEILPFEEKGLVIKNIHAQSKEVPVKMIYFTDPICSSCWGIEPQLRKLKLEYGKYITIEYRMGGLLPNWSYNSGGISKPSDVAHHWDEVSIYYDMPIDGDVWLQDPLQSSFPPSVAFKGAQIQDNEKAVVFLRELRELVFLEKKNITRWEHITEAAQKAGLDVKKLKTDFENSAKLMFEQDLEQAKGYGVRAFPTIFFENNNGDREIISGSKPYSFYETALLKLYPDADKYEYSKDWKSLFSIYNSLTAREFSELSGIQRDKSEEFLNQLTDSQKLIKTQTKNGSIWRLKL